MTSNQLKAQEIKEAKRSNRAKENLTREEIATKKYDSHLKGIKTFADTVLGVGALASKNDASWYTKDAQLAKDVANLSFNQPFGNEVQTLNRNQMDFSTNEAIPGVTTITYIPTIGYTESVNGNAADVAAISLYAYVRHANSGSKNYERANLMMYLFAMDQAYTLWALMRKLYSLGLTSKGYNRYYNDAMIKSLGFQPNSIRNNLADFRAFINAYAMKLNSLYVPKGLPLIDRHQWLVSNIFKDQPIKKSPEYQFRPVSFGYYDSRNNRIKFEYLSYDRVKHDMYYTLDDLKNAATIIIDAIIADEDIGIMSGDILKAYGESRVYFVPSTPEDFHIESIYSEEVLSQITNCELIGELPMSYDTDNHNTYPHPDQVVHPTYALTTKAVPTGVEDSHDFFADYAAATPYDIWETEDGSIVQGVPFVSSFQASDTTDLKLHHVAIPCNNNLYDYCSWSYEARINSNYVSVNEDVIAKTTNNHLLSFYKDDVSTDDVLVATRGKINISSSTQVAIPVLLHYSNLEVAVTRGPCIHAWISSCGTEVFQNAFMFTISVSDNGVASTELLDVLGYINYDVSELIDGNPGTKPEIAQHISKLEWFPQAFMVAHMDDDLKPSQILTQVGNYTVFSRDVLSNMHYVCVLSELGIPELGLNVRSRR